MEVHQIQAVVMKCLRMIGVPKVFRETLYSISGEPVEGVPTIKSTRNMVWVKFIASREEYDDFNQCCKYGGVHVSARWEPQVGTHRFVYTVSAVERY